MRYGNLLFAVAAVLAALGGCSQAEFDQLTNPGECRTLINMGRMPPRNDAECARYDAGMARQREARASKDAADMAVIDDYFRRYPTTPQPDACKPLVNEDGSSASMPWMVNQCRRDIELIAHIDGYFRAHPTAPRPEACSLPLRSGFLGKCGVDIEAAEAPLPPPPEWHTIVKDTIGCYRNGVYGDGRYLGSTEGCIEIHSGQTFLLQPTSFRGKGGSITFLSPLAYKSTTVSNGVSSLTIPTNAFDPKVRHCRAKTVLLHQEVTCDD